MRRFVLGAMAVFGSAVPALAQAPATPGVHVRAEVAAQAQQHFTRADANRDGAVTLEELQALRPVGRGQGGGRGNGRGFFTRFDTNSDGTVTRAEFDAGRAARAQQQGQPENGRGEGMFARLDSNSDGSISRAEFDAARQQSGQNMGQGRRAGGPMPVGLTALAPQLFGMTDANKDGRVTLQEAQAAALSQFDMADSNKDGQVTPQEHQQMREQMRQHMPN